MKEKISKIKEMYKVSGYHKQFLILFTIIISFAILDIITIPYLTRKIINVYIPKQNIKALVIFCCCYIVFLLISCCFTLKHCNMRSILERKIQRDLREKVFNKMQDVKTKFYDENDTGVILQFIQSDVNESGKLFADVITEMIFMGIVRFIIYAIFLMFVDIKTTFIILLLYLAGYLVTLYFNGKTVSLIDRIRQTNIAIYSKVNEGVQGFLTIKTLNIIEKKEEELKELLEEYEISNDKLERNVALYNNLFSFIVSLATAIIIYFAGGKVASGVMAYVEIMLLIEFSGSLEFEFKCL